MLINKKNISNIAKIDWVQRWSGSYTFISCSFWGPEYFYNLQKILGINFRHTLFVHKKGVVDFYVAKTELNRLGKTLAKRVSSSLIKKYYRLIKANTDKLVKLMKKLNNKVPTWKQYQEFLKPFENHLAYHGFIKETVDYLSPQMLNRHLRNFQYAREYSERIYSDSEIFFRDLADAIARKEKRNKNLLTCLTQNELEQYLKHAVLPPDKILKPRFRQCVLFFENGRVKYFFDSQAKQLEGYIVKQSLNHKKFITGHAAYPGKIKGICKIVPNPNQANNFNSGDILVTGMTRPEFLPLIKKASAIITDSGGVLSHAAITARELRVPCVVGTQIATKILKNNQLVELDGGQGTIKVLK